MTLQEFFKKTFFVIVKQKSEALRPYSLRPRIICNDGFSMSVQANCGAYSKPRKMHHTYESAEIGYPSSNPNEEVMKYAESDFNPTETVYPYVPCDLIQSLINEHGGINVDDTMKNWTNI